MKLYESKERCCEADVTMETSVVDRRISRNPLSGRYTIRRGKRVMHFRASDGARFWHWSDRQVVKI